MPGSRTQHLHGLDLLRAAAIVMVLLAHMPKVNYGLASRVLNFGWTGVDLFFVLSGFLIGGQVFQSIQASGESWLGRFYVRRLLRTLPPYYAILAVYFGLAASGMTLAPTRSFLWFTQNFGVPSTFTASWSLCVEEQFYLLFPFVALLLVRLRGGRGLVSAIVLFLACEIALRAAIWFSFRPDLAMEPQALSTYMGHLYYPTYCRLDGIALGVGIAALQNLHPKLWALLTKNGHWLTAGACASLALAVLALWKHYSLAGSTAGFTLLNVSFAMFTAAAVSGRGWLGSIRIPGVPYLAAISYSVYLTHSLAIELVSRLAEQWRISRFSLGASILTLAAIAVFSIILHYGVERPFLAIRDRVQRAGRPRVRLEREMAAPANELSFSSEGNGS